MIDKLSRWIRALRAAVSGTRNPAQWLIDWIRGGHGSDSGITLDGKTALRYAPVWYAVRRISGHVAQLPLVLFEQTGERTKRRATEHPAYRLMKKRPNAAMNASVFRELLQYHALVWGAGRALIVRNQRMDPVELIPLLPHSTKTIIVAGEKWHVTDIVVDSDTHRTEQRKFRDRDVLHIVGLGYDGITGYPLWELAKNSWGLGVATEKYGNRFFRNNAVPGLILEAPAGVLTDEEEAKQFLQAFRAMQEGLDNVSRTALLRNGIKATKLAASGQESQWIEQRKFQRQEVALWFLLEAITGDDSSVSYNSLEQKHLAYLVNCLNGWLVKWQEECEEKLLREREKLADSHFFRFQTGALLRADMASTVTTLTTAIRGLLMTPNEARERLDLDAMEGGDELVNPAITPGTAGAGESDRVRDRITGVITARLTELLAVERRRVSDLAAKSPAAGEWPERLETFYRGWSDTLARALAPFSGTVSAETLAQAWCDRSLGDLAPLTDRQQITAALEAWTDRVGALASVLAGEMLEAEPV